MTERQESETNFSAIGDLEIVISTAEPTTRLEIFQLGVLPKVETLDQAATTATQVAE